jgi:hypothetical protein
MVTPGTSEDEDEALVLFSTPPRPAGESQGGTTIIVALRDSPREPRQQPPQPKVTAFYRLCPEEPDLPPASTAPRG